MDGQGNDVLVPMRERGEEQGNGFSADLERLGTPRRGVAIPAARRLRLRPFLWLLLLVAIAGASIWYSARPENQAKTSNRTQYGGSVPVAVSPVLRGDMPILLRQLGTVLPLTTVTVKTNISGYLMNVAFTEGQLVKAGDFLVQIDPRPFQVALEQAEGQLAKDQALLKNAQLDLERYNTLVAQNSIARQTRDTQVSLVAQYQATVKSDHAQIDTQKLNLTYAHIVTPVTGRVGLRLVDPGNYVQTSDPNGIVVITQLQPISVIFTLPEDKLPAVLQRLRAGASLPVTAFDRTGITELAKGRVETIDNQIDTTTGTIKLRAIFDNEQEILFPNQFVNVELLVDTMHNTEIVPNPAIQHGAPGTFVYVVKPDQSVAVQKVKLGPSNGERIAILSGLQPGESVVIDGADRLRDGTKVTPVLAGGEKQQGRPDAVGARSAPRPGTLSVAAVPQQPIIGATQAPSTNEAAPPNKPLQTTPALASEPLTEQPTGQLPFVAPTTDTQPLTSQPTTEIAALVARGDDLMNKGDITSARLFYERAFQAGDRRAALRMGVTFDPAFLDRVAFRGTLGNQEEARSWYRRASNLGAVEPDRRLMDGSELQPGERIVIHGASVVADGIKVTVAQVGDAKQETSQPQAIAVQRAPQPETLSVTAVPQQPIGGATEASSTNDAAALQKMPLNEPLRTTPAAVSVARPAQPAGTRPVVVPATQPPEPRPKAKQLVALTEPPPYAGSAVLVTRGDDCINRGDIASARLFYERAFEAGDGRAALRMGVTFDPVFLARAGVRGGQGNQNEALSWYRRAGNLDAANAERRISDRSALQPNESVMDGVDRLRVGHGWQ
jgi:multidrug efflux system membrane fusion protein